MTHHRNAPASCGVCAAPTRDALHLCVGCLDQLHGTLHQIPETLAELWTESVRLSRHTRPQNRQRATETALPYRGDAADTHRALRRTLHDTAHLASPRPIPAITPAYTLTAVIDAHLDRLALHPDAPRHHAELTHLNRRGRAIIDNPPERRYIGECHCGTRLHADLDWATVTCHHCGDVWDVTQRHAQTLDDCRDVLLTLTEIATLLPAPLRRVQAWAERGRITPAGTTTTGARLYRFGDALQHAALTTT